MNKKFSICLLCFTLFLMTKNTYAHNYNSLENNQLLIDTVFTDNFSAQHINKWSNTNDWTIADSLLKHNLSDIAGTSYIYNHLIDSLFYSGTTTWKISLKSDFDVSSSNKFWYWLMASDSLLSTTETNGYAIGVCIAGTAKNVSLYRIDDGSKKTLLCTSDYEWAKNTWVDLIVERQPKGIWQIECIPAVEPLDTIFSESFSDDTYNNFAYHGLSFTYSKTRAGLLYADNISIVREAAPISLISAIYDGISTLELTFSGKLEATSASERRNYSIEGSSIEDVIFNNDEPTKVKLRITPIKSGSYTIIANGIIDNNGNEIDKQTAEFSYTAPTQPYDLVFNELMFDPSPIVGLPNYDYLEIYNRSNSAISLGGWTLDISGTIRQIPDSIIKSGDYLILTSAAALDTFHIYGKAVAAITTTNLTNTGRTLRLISPEGVTIDSLTYTEKSIIDANKNNGGWAFERIDPNNFCGNWNNWAFSIDERGGTPGEQNSVYRNNIDNEPIKIVNFIPYSLEKLKIELSEAPTTQTLSLMSNFTIKGIGNPIEHELDGTTLTLTFARKFDSDTHLELKIANLEDACGNVMTDTILQFSYHNVGLYELVINEIYATPSDNGLLPDYEWVEIYNRSNFDIFLNGFSLGVGTKKYTIESGSIAAGSYAVLAKATIADSLTNFANVIGVKSMPTLAMSATLAIYNNADEIVCRTAYSNSWFTDDLKASGGCSLERIDFDNADESVANWAQSENPNGATPCDRNSVHFSNPDTAQPQLLQAVPITSKKLHLIFSETMNIAPTDLQKIDIQPNIGNPVKIELLSTSLSSIVATFATDLIEDEVYTVVIDSTSTDIAGNLIDNHTYTFGLPKKAEVGNIVINELLFNPYTGGSDFIELYNRSNHPINIADFMIASHIDGNLKNPKRIDSPGFILMPNCYVAISADIKNISSTYNCGNLYQVSALPSMPDDAGNVALIDTAGNIFDEVSYTNDMHFALLKDLNGVSLERIDFSQPSDNQANWHSASQLSGWATPGLQNSVYKNITTESTDHILLNNEVFSPDNDGFDDQLEIAYNFDVAGYVANVTIFSAKGLKMRSLISNELLGTNGFWAWDGLDDDKHRVPTGIYVIYCELFDLDGHVKKEQKVCVVSSKMD